MDRYTAAVGDYVEPDEWKHGGDYLLADDGYRDSEFPGCMFRLQSSHGHKLAVNVHVTGKPHYCSIDPSSSLRHFRSRCRIEFVQDGNMPPVITGGWIYHA